MPLPPIPHLVGGAGFAILLAATQVRSRSGFLVVDLCGLVAVTAHYVLLGAPAGAAMSALYLAIDATAVLEERTGLSRRWYLALYALAAGLLGLTYEAPADLAALFGTFAAVASRQQTHMRPLLLLLVVSSFGWGLYGWLVGSISQILFSVAYATFGLLGVWRIGRQTHA